MSTPDVMALLREADEAAGALNLDILRYGKETIQGPAVGRKLKKPERAAGQRALLGNPLQLEAVLAQKSAQYQLTPEKPISRRVIKELLDGARELAEEEAKDAT